MRCGSVCSCSLPVFTALFFLSGFTGFAQQNTVGSSLSPNQKKLILDQRVSDNERELKMDELRKVNKSSRTDKVLKKLKAIIIDKVSFEEVSIPTAIRYLRQCSKEKDPEKTGVNFVLLGKINKTTGVSESAAADTEVTPLTIELDNLPLETLIRYICRQANLKYRIDDNAVVIASKEVPLDYVETEVYPADSGPGEMTGKRAELYKKLQKTIVELVECENANIQFMFEHLASQYSINIILPRKKEHCSRKIQYLKLEKTPLLDVIRYICEVAYLKFEVDENSVTISVQNEDEMKIRRLLAQRIKFKANGTGEIQGKNDSIDKLNDAERFFE